ncbi:MAG: barstar family protein [Oscillospiraceae bacterium]|nr:barstar family protein [Oscillospiraceae bacterium]
MTKILFVCHGNICRSPAAELILRELLRRAGLSDAYELASAATSREEIGNGVYPPMRRVLEEHGLDCSGKTARQIRRSDYEHYDLLIGMDEENLWDMRRAFGGDPEGKLRNFLDFAGLSGQEIADPWYTRDFRRAYEEIRLACEGLLYHLTGVVTVDFSLCPDIPSLYRELRGALQWEDWYGENLDALYDILTGLPHRGERFLLTMPREDAPKEARLYAARIRDVFAEAGALIGTEDGET